MVNNKAKEKKKNRKDHEAWGVLCGPEAALVMHLSSGSRSLSGPKETQELEPNGVGSRRV